MIITRGSRHGRNVSWCSFVFFFSNHVIAGLPCMQAPAEVMAAFLTHLDDTYGGPLGYLDSIGFTKKHQTRLRQAVCVTGSQTAAL